MIPQNTSQGQYLPINVRSLFTKTQIFGLFLAGSLFFLSVIVLPSHGVIPKDTENFSMAILIAGWIVGLTLVLLSFVVGIIRAFRKDFKILVSSVVLLILVLILGFVAGYLAFATSFR